jgi:hypothetical protein
MAIRVRVQEALAGPVVKGHMTARLHDDATAGLFQIIAVGKIGPENEIAWAVQGIHWRQVEAKVKVKAKDGA